MSQRWAEFRPSTRSAVLALSFVLFRPQHTMHVTMREDYHI